MNRHIPNSRPGHHHGATPAGSCCAHESNDSVAQEKPYTDPVCGMKVAANPEKSVEHDGQTYYFCSQGCVTKFRSNPHQYLHRHSSAAAPSDHTPKDAIYTCPMHPEIRQVGPGACPICGMALEPLMATVEEDT